MTILLVIQALTVKPVTDLLLVIPVVGRAEASFENPKFRSMGEDDSSQELLTIFNLWGRINTVKSFKWKTQSYC
jgi:lipopolysaccharide/colanic/teichoic acid biosynthesis glycosyltransferase